MSVIANSWYVLRHPFIELQALCKRQPFETRNVALLMGLMSCQEEPALHEQSSEHGKACPECLRPARYVCLVRSTAA